MRPLPVLFLPLLLLLAALVYWPGLAGEFVFDDYGSIVSSQALRLFDGSWAGLVDASTAGVASPLGRPLSQASFAANLYFTGDSPFYFKLVNLLIHLANGLLAYLLVRQLWPRLLGDGRDRLAAFWTAAVWLLHPINLTPVLYAVQRMTSLAAFFTLAALCLYLHGRQASGLKRWAAISASLLVCWPAGILAKETALLLPLFILLCEWLALSAFRSLTPRVFRIGLALLFVAAAGIMAAAWPLVEKTYLIRDFGPGERLLTEARVLWLYVVQMLLPWPDLFSLHHDDIAISRGFFDPPLTAAAVLAWLSLFVVALQQRGRRPWLAFAVLWFLAGHALESGILGLEIAYEHRNYLPSFGIFLGLAAWLLPAAAGSFGRLPRLAFAFAFAFFCGLVTGLRADQWGDEYVRTQIEANTHPTSARTHYDTAMAILNKTLHKGFMNVPAYHMSRIHFQRAAQYDPRNKAALAGILYLDCAVSMKRDDEAWEALKTRLATMPFALGDQSFIRSLSDILVNNLLCLKEDEVDTLLAAALSNPTAVGKMRGMLHALAMDYAAARLKSLPRARLHARAAVDSDPGNVPLRINLIRVLVGLNELDEAKRQYAALSRLRIPAVSRKEVENLGLGLGG